MAKACQKCRGEIKEDKLMSGQFVRYTMKCDCLEVEAYSKMGARRKFKSEHAKRGE